MAGQYVAFDIGEAQVKIVSFAGGKVKKAVSEELPDRLVAGGEILSMDAMGDFLKEVARKNGIGRGNAGVILLSGVYPERDRSAYDRRPACL